MKKISFIFMLFWAAGGILAGCDNTLDGSGTYEPLYLEVAVSDSLGNTYTGDSIVIPTDKNKIIFDISTNSGWRASRENKVGLNGWLSIPSKAAGGGDAVITSTVVANLTSKDKKVYYYILTTGSAVVRKIVIVQPHPSKQ